MGIEEFKFLDDLDSDIKQSLLDQLRDLWTHTSTAIEGNTLTLGDTKFILDEGLTVSGKPIKDHDEVIGHAKAIALIYSFIGRDLVDQDVFNLHKAVQTEFVSDIYKPLGSWKVEFNGTNVLDDEGKQVYIEYASPSDVSILMEEIIKFINVMSHKNISLAEAPSVYAKIHMGLAHTHPFWDGNGRIARLMSNIPLLNSGLPPLLIASEDRREYIDTLASYQLQVGVISVKSGVWPDESMLEKFIKFCDRSYSFTNSLVKKARITQTRRNAPVK